MKSTVLYHQSGRWGNYTVHIENLDTLMRFLDNHDPKMKQAIQDGLKEAAKPVLQKARANAWHIADDGTYAKSLRVLFYESKNKLVLSAYDKNAPVKEFALPGATYKPKPTDKRRNARKMSSFPVGVPKRANAPRVMLPAVNDSVDEVKTRIGARIDECFERILSGNVGN